MGVVIHEAMIVTSWDAVLLGAARQAAINLFGERYVSPLTPTMINQYRTFIIQSSGSKQGWEESEVHHARLIAMTVSLRGMAHEDGSNSVEWVVVQYGNDLDEKKPRVLEFPPTGE